MLMIDFFFKHLFIIKVVIFLSLKMVFVENRVRMVLNLKNFCSQKHKKTQKKQNNFELCNIKNFYCP